MLPGMNFSALQNGLKQRPSEGIIDRSLSGSYIARELGVSQAHVSNILSGQRGMSFDLADRLLDLIPARIEDLVARDAIAGGVPFQPTTIGSYLTVPVIVAANALKPN